MDIALRDLVNVIGGEISGDGSATISGVAGIKEARQGDITFLANPKYEGFLKSTRTSAIIVSRGTEHTGRSIVLSDNPYLTFIKAVEFFVPRRNEYPRTIHPTAVVGYDVRIGTGVAIGPHVVIDEGVEIGNGTVILAGTYVGRDAEIGEDCLIYPNVTIREEIKIGSRVIVHGGAVIGSDGFGFARDGEIHRKIPQIGNVVIEDDVEIGANVTIDRATTGTTVIGQGTKVDNLVQIAHNVTIGENCILIAQVGIGGSTEPGSGVSLAGQAGAVGHIKIGDGATVAAQAGVTKSIAPGMMVSGYPAREHSQAKKIYASLQRLPNLIKRVADLAERIRKMEEKSEE